MSKIGNNIRKIRSIKNLNQNDFANIFKLKRASIGAYEEGRAEPKITTLIEIANYFGISTDDLLKKDLSVNDLYRFDIFRDDLIKDSKHNLNPTVLPVEVIAIPYISLANRPVYFKNKKDISGFESIYIPMPKGMNYIAFQMADNAMYSNGTGAQTEDIIIASKPVKFGIDDIEVGKLYVFELEDEILFRKLSNKGLSKLTLQAANPNHYNQQVNTKDILNVWQVSKLITNNIGNTESLNSKLSQMEQDLAQLKRNLQNNG